MLIFIKHSLPLLVLAKPRLGHHSDPGRRCQGLHCSLQCWKASSAGNSLGGQLGQDV